MYDVTIIGAGPAGATLAKIIGRQYRVLLVDRRESDDERENRINSNCCGGLLAPDAQAMLSRLGLGLPKKVLVDPQIFVVRTIDLEQNLEQYYQRFYINMDRRKFDAWLWSMLPDSVDTRSGFQFRSYDRKESCFEIRLSRDGKSYTEKTKIIVGADGGHSTVRKQAFAAHQTPDPYFAIQEWVVADSPLPYFSAIFDREITNYYSWVIPKDGHLVIGSALEPRKNAAEKFNLLKDKMRRYGLDTGRTVTREGAFIERPSKVKQVLVGRDGIVLIGEAAGWISPSSAEGISYAFRSAILLAESLSEGLEGFEERYRRKARSLRINIRLKNAKSPFIFHPLLRKIVMRSGIKSVDVDSEKPG